MMNTRTFCVSWARSMTFSAARDRALNQTTAFGHAEETIALDNASCKIPGMWIIASTQQTVITGEVVQSPDILKLKKTETFIFPMGKKKT